MCSKPLIELIKTVDGFHLVARNVNSYANVAISHITQDSRSVVAGTLFAAIKGGLHNGEDYIEAAIAAGAVAILVGEDYDLTPHGSPAGVDKTIFITHHNPRLGLSLLAQAFYQPQPQHRVAITGTDGKTSTAEFTRQLWELCGANAASIGTLGLKSARPLINLPPLSDNTSPEPASFYHTLSECARQGVQHVAVEASSIGIEQHRLAGFAPNVAIFTSFSQDHLDYHGTMEAYFNTKAKLFHELQGTSILCTDYAEIAQLAGELKAQGKHVITYGAGTNADLHIQAITPFAGGQLVQFTYGGADFKVTAPLYGDFQAYNLLAASLAVGIDLQLLLEHILQYWTQIQPIKGRLQLAGVKEGAGIKEGAGTTAQGALIFVDYAHTAGALEKALQTLRPYATHKLHVLFGCGGNRDTGKRPQMGAVAASLADAITITDDNPREENAASIRASIMAACPHATEIACRAQAIAHAMVQLQAGDVLLIAGKGHEDYQIIGTTKHPFDDALEVQKNLIL